MSDILTKAFKKASKLPKNLQEEVARQLLEDIEGELNWDETLFKSHDKLEKLADKAIEEFKAGHTKQMGFDKL